MDMIATMEAIGRGLLVEPYLPTVALAGRLVPLLEDFAAPPNGIYMVFPQRKHMPLRVRLWIDFLKMHYERPEFWRQGVIA